MNISIIFHSVCGNDYLIAKAFQQEFQMQNQNARLFRVQDPDFTMQEDYSNAAKAVIEEMLTVPAAEPECALDADIILLGSPTYFGNVSAEMKTFMDSLSKYWIAGKLAGKKAAGFTSFGSSENGGNLCLQAIQILAQHMGMLYVPIPTTLIEGKIFPPYGVWYNSKGKYAEELDSDTKTLIKEFSKYLIKV